MTHPFNKNFKDKQKLIFLSLAELGWELFRWSGFVRKYKLDHPEKIICAATRENRSDIYHGVVDGIYTFNIKGDYTKFRANMYRLDFFPENKYNKLINDIKIKFPNFYIVKMPKCTVGKNFFSQEQMDFNFTPRPENFKVIENILSEYKKRIPICISPRHRTDSPKPTRNWPEQYWQDLFTRIRLTNKYVTFIIGGISSIITPPKDRNFIVLDNIVANNTSNIGLTIEAIKRSCVTIGQQSALPILSNYLQTPVISWGHEKVRHQIRENPYNTRCIFFEESTVQYRTSPKLIFESLIKETI